MQWWKTDGTHVKTVLLKGTFGKYIRFSPDFCTFVTIENAGLLYILTTLQVQNYNRELIIVFKLWMKMCVTGFAVFLDKSLTHACQEIGDIQTETEN